MSHDDLHRGCQCNSLFTFIDAVPVVNGIDVTVRYRLIYKILVIIQTIMYDEIMVSFFYIM